jgi:hypothetical protein
LSEIDANAKATFRSITLATMMRLVDRQDVGVASDPAQGDRVAAALVGRLKTQASRFT